jgi:hypothetical protein
MEPYLEANGTPLLCPPYQILLGQAFRVDTNLVAAEGIEKKVHVAHNGADGFDGPCIRGWLANQHVYQIHIL